MSGSKAFLHWCVLPPASRVGRDVVGAFLLGQGIIRMIDGRLFNTVPLEYAPSWIYALIQVILGAGILLTSSCRWRHTFTGRLIASITAGFCAMLVVASFEVSATSAWGALVLCWVCVLEAGAREC